VSETLTLPLQLDLLLGADGIVRGVVRVPLENGEWVENWREGDVPLAFLETRNDND